MKTERSLPVKKVITLLFTILLCACIPITVYANTITPAPSEKTVAKETRMGEKYSRKIEEHVPRVHEPATEARLACIAQKLIPFYGRNLKYEVRILDMEMINAFSLPGGITYITTGMLDFLKSDDEIAGVLAHEFTHADRAHVLVQSARDSRLNIITLLGIIAATQGVGAPALMMSGALQTAFSNSYSIDLEKEADARGIDAMNRAGFNPAGMLTMQERLHAENLKKAHFDPGIYQTHPENEERIDAAKKYMKDNKIPIKRKRVINKAIVSVQRKENILYLNIDNYNLFNVPFTEENMQKIYVIRNLIDENIELETPPYDIQVIEVKGESILMISGKSVIKVRDTFDGMPSLQVVSDRLNHILTEIRLETPLTEYFD